MNRCIGLLALVMFLSVGVFAAASVEKVEPPNWWTGMENSTVRVLLRGKELKGKSVISKFTGIKVANFTSSENGHYLFFDLTISKNAVPGKYNFAVGDARFVFEILARQPQIGRYQGYSPNDVIYFLMPDRFADGDASNNDPAKSKGLLDRSKGRSYHGGDLQGVIDKLPYLKSLGVTAIWTTPVYDNNDKYDQKEVYDGQASTGYHGYGAIDMYAVEERFGDMAKLQELAAKARSMGIKMIQDQVANHTGPYHVWAEDPPTPTWWNGTVKDHIPNDWQKWTAMNPRASRQTQKSNVDGWFIDILPDFNQNDPEVEKYLIQNSIWWLEMVGYDAIRMDTLPHVPRSFWQKWGSSIKRQYPKVNILGELFDNDPVLVAYFQGGRKGHDGIDTNIDTLFDFGLFYPIRSAFAQGKPVREVSQMLSRDWIYKDASVMTTFLGVHDMGRFMNEPGATTDGLKLAQTFIMTTRGTPILYYGDEIAMPGGGDPDNRRDFPGGFPGDKRDAFTSDGRTAVENDVWNHLAKLGEIRQRYAALRNGSSLDLYNGEQQMAYARYTDAEAVLVVINNDTKPAKIKFSVAELKPFANVAELKDALGKMANIKISDGVVNIDIPARSSGIFVTK